ncbi:MAG: type 4a pilus biogenesis protein PilO [Patescibacteria group bacterium]
MSYSFKNTVLVFINKYFKYIQVAVIVILLISSVYLILLPKYRQISGEGYLDYENKQLTLDAKKKQLVELNELKNDLSQISTAETERLGKILPSSSQIPDIFLQMESLALESGLTVNSVSIKDSGAAQNAASSNQTAPNGKSAVTNKLGAIKTITVSLSVKGDTTYESLKILLDNIENNMRIVDLDSLSFVPPLDEEEGSFSLNLNTYYLE